MLAGIVAAGGARPSAVVLCALVAFVPYGALLWLPPAPGDPGVRLATWLALAAGAVLVVAPPVLSDDVFRYLWDGRVLAHGISPYRYAPHDPALAHLRDELFGRVNNPEIATIYPPLAQGLFAAADSVWHHPASLKVVALLAHLGSIRVVARLAGENGPRAALLYGLNPLALVESALGGHVDAVAGLAVAGAVAALLSNRALVAALLVGAASGLKLIGIALAPLVALRDRRAAALAVLLAMLPVFPLLGAGGGVDGAGITHYTRRWRGNEGPFVVLEAVAAAVVSAVASDVPGAGPGQVRLPFLAPLVHSLDGTPLDLRATLAGEKKAEPDPTAFDGEYLAALLARALALAFVLGLAVFLVLGRVEPLVAARWVLLTALLLAPQVHPWYLLWLLPIEVASGGRAGIVWSAAVLVAYAPLDAWVAGRVWHEAPLARLVEYALVVGVLTAEALPVGKNGSATPVHVG